MIDLLAAMFLAAAEPQKEVTLPRQLDPQLLEKPEDQPVVATDDPAFIVAAVEAARQSGIDARGVQKGLATAPLRDTAASINRQNEATLNALETLAQRKGWRLPEKNPMRASTLPAAGPHRTGANFIRSQISAHRQTLRQFRAQIAGKGDPDLKRALQDAMPGYEKNLQRLLEAKLQ